MLDYTSKASVREWRNGALPQGAKFGEMTSLVFKIQDLFFSNYQFLISIHQLWGQLLKFWHQFTNDDKLQIAIITSNFNQTSNDCELTSLSKISLEPGLRVRAFFAHLGRFIWSQKLNLSRFENDRRPTKKVYK